MYQVKVIYDNDKDKELLDKVETVTPFFVDYINMNSINDRKNGMKLMGHWSAKKLPLVIIETDNESLPVVKYSDIGENAVNQLIKFLNESSNQETCS